MLQYLYNITVFIEYYNIYTILQYFHKINVFIYFSLFCWFTITKSLINLRVNHLRYPQFIWNEGLLCNDKSEMFIIILHIYDDTKTRYQSMINRSFLDWTISQWLCIFSWLISREGGYDNSSLVNKMSTLQTK